MKVIQEKLPDSQVGLEIEIPATASKKVYENVVKKLTRTVNIPGFRRGKVPRAIVIQRLGQSYIKATAIEELIDDSIKAAVKQEELAIIGNFSLRSDMEDLLQAFDPEAPLTIKVAADVFPEAEYEPESYKTITTQAEEIEYSADAVDQWLKGEQEKRATLVPVEDRPAAMGDVAIVDYAAFELAEGGESGEAIAEVKGSDFEVTLEEGRFVAGIVDGIAGMAIDETKLIPVTFPEDYPLEAVAGENVLFEIKLKEIKFRELPELDDDFAEDVSEFETLAELRADLEKQFQEQAEERTNNNIKAAIKGKLGELFTGALPETMIKQECDRLVAQTAMELERMGLDVSQLFRQGDDMLQTLKNNARPEAIANLKTQLMIGAIAKEEKIEPTEAEIKERCDELRREFKGEKIDESRLLSFVESSLVEDKVLNLLKEWATVELLPEGSLSQTEETDDNDDGEGAPIDVEADSEA
ncbi:MULTISPECIES: trigger factor [unclassified Synechocystis]|uniref:trigger factor n=1 Tax=unclassified Synechocystis TaxID=2640012 RepID=UPI0003F99410|nr:MULTISPECIES: trigger factor [unclassified Synechocystis]AIE75292.1 Cell division trigger factor [Synechocystis sp. PCC 6714]MCT0253032.1 trigger factor [Synechocystis sp. CS-94]